MHSRRRFSSDSRSPAQATPPQPPADLIVTNARIYTVDDSRPFVEAFAVRGGRIAFVGDARGALTLRGPQTRVLDLGGRTVIPGMVDAHGHVAGLGSALAIVDLTGASSYDEIIARVVAKAKTVAPGVWVTGTRLGPEPLGRHAVPHAREAVGGRAEQPGAARARRRAREPRQQEGDGTRRA